MYYALSLMIRKYISYLACNMLQTNTETVHRLKENKDIEERTSKEYKCTELEDKMHSVSNANNIIHLILPVNLHINVL